MSTDDVVLNKAAVIERCLRRVREEHAGVDSHLLDNVTRQDSIILNLQRACEAAIDLAMHLVRVRRLGIPQDSRDAFTLLAEAQIITPSLAQRLKAMVGFRNLAVHDYQELNLRIVLSIIHSNLSDLEEFARVAIGSA